MELKPCPFCGGKKLVRSVDGGILPSFIDADKQGEIFEKTPYVTSCELSCELCGAQVEDYAASNNLHDNLYEKAIKNCYEKWNRRATIDIQMLIDYISSLAKADSADSWILDGDCWRANDG